ncbi:MAG: MFS transporter [Gemmatimonadaceae bacterium]|nr:MFS transporter [Chitinophagaceae bacterium]
MTQTEQLKNDPFASLRFPEFRNYVISRFFFIFTLNMQATLVSWEVYNITRDPFTIGLMGLVEFVPAFFMAFYSGHHIDRSDKRNVLRASIGGNLVCTALLCLATSALFIGGFGKMSTLYTIGFVVFCTGILRSFSGPSSFALVTQLVPKNLTANAASWHTGVWQVGAVAGPAAGGIMYGAFGITYTFLIMLLFMSIAFFGIFFISKKPILAPPKREAFVESVKQGFRFVWKSKEVLGALSLDLFAVLFGGAVALLPVYADTILHVDANGLGMLRSAPALGAVITMVIITFKPLKKNQGKIMLGCVAGFGVCIIVFGISEVFWLSALALMVSGLLDGFSVIVRSTILQLKTPDEMRGRVAALNGIFILSSNELGAFESGTTAKLMGPVAAVVFGGTMTLIVVAYMWAKAPTLRKLEY